MLVGVLLALGVDIKALGIEAQSVQWRNLLGEISAAKLALFSAIALEQSKCWNCASGGNSWSYTADSVCSGGFLPPISRSVVNLSQCSDVGWSCTGEDQSQF